MYATLAEVRALNGLGDSSVHSDALLTEALAYAKRIVDRATGTSFGNVETPAFDSFSVTLDGTGGSSIFLRDREGRPILFPQTISSASINGVADSGITYKFKSTGWAWRDSGVWSVDSDGFGQNVVIAGTAGVTDGSETAAYEDLYWAARTIARYYALNDTSRLPDRALNLTTPEGSFEVRAQAGGPGRPTNMPDVNAVLARHTHIKLLG